LRKECKNYVDDVHEKINDFKSLKKKLRELIPDKELSIEFNFNGK
jgi:hypothetical protein